MAYVFHRGTRVSKSHAAMLSAYEDRYGVALHVNEGARTWAEQAKFYAHFKRFGRPLAAKPSLSAPHIKWRKDNHALDINAGTKPGQAQHVAAFYRQHGVPVAFNVPGERWHMDVLDEADLKRAASKFSQVDPTLREGHKGPSVVRLKKLLYANGIRNFSGAKNSNRYVPYFGKYTKAAVRRFQIANNLTPDGVVGSSTWRKLRG